MFTYTAIIKRIVDGDTVDVDIDLGFDIWIHNERIRLWDIDCPESRTSNDVERIFGKAATNYLESILPLGAKVTLYSKSFNTGKYGRIIGDFQVPGYKDSVCNLLIETRHAVPYSLNKTKEELEKAHEANRQYLVESGEVVIPEELMEEYNRQLND